MKETIPFDPWLIDFLSFCNKNLSSQQFHVLIKRSFGDTLDECAKDCKRKSSLAYKYKRVPYVDIFNRETFRLVKISKRKKTMGVSRERARKLISESQRKLSKHSFKFGIEK